MTNTPANQKPQLTSPVTCKQKHTYWSYDTAHKAAQRRNKAAGYKYLRAYKCNQCYGWHVTTERKVES
jgi:hypothetical protein